MRTIPSVSPRRRLSAATAVVLALLTAAGACRESDVLTRSAGAPPATAEEPGQSVQAPRLRARVVTVSLEAKDVQRAAAAVRRIVTRHEGWVATAFERREDEGTASFDLRVPDAALGAFRADLARLGEVTADREEVEDVTDQVVDVEARLRVARREEERLLALLAERTASLGDVVALESRLSDVRERIERMDASARALEDRVTFARVHVDVLPLSLPYWQRPLATIGDAASWGLEVVQAVLIGGAAAVLALGPTALVLLAAMLAVVVAVRSRRRLRRARA